MFFTFELSPFPRPLFNEERMRKGSKSSLFSAFTPTKIDAVQGKINFVVVDRGHLLHKVGWQRNMNFGDIAKSCLTYLQTHYGSNIAVVFDGYPSDVNGKSTKSAKRIRRANLHSSHEIIFNEATCQEISQEQFLANKRNKKKNRCLKEKIQVFLKSEVTIDQVAKAGETFMIHLYGGIPRTSACDFNHLRYTLFTQSATKARSTLARLPPTVDAARFHALRSYLQIQKWLGHEKNPLEWGWVPTRFGLSPSKMERDAAPESLLKIISCVCKKGCKNVCGCRKAGLICSSLCTCFLTRSRKRTCQTSIYFRTALKMKTTRHRQ
ncbi:hypothetical protein AVEN_237332-1 [Araneus ventricosus]|uniref:Tesmin/TSO1-like CXC domain-containing protein n=1 Tax=Araneus ventricosus TaxID=182803 RepID=A0A4Y2IC67_ARAVE|nr:hypothetical protein AVEN_237332-1 [Araneus ventricosus]